METDEKVEETLSKLTEGVIEHGHKMTLSEALAVVIHGDRERSPDISNEYSRGPNKTILDQVARRLRQAGWRQRKVQRFGSRRVRWVNPELDD